MDRFYIPIRRVLGVIALPEISLAILIAASIVYRISYLLRPFDWLCGFFTADDFYYYTQTAWNVAHGFGSSCDAGLTHHNGYHPLFMWLIVPAFWLGANKEVGAIWGLSILVTANIIAVWLAWRVTARNACPRLALVPAAMIGLNMYFVQASLMGFEWPLALCFMLALYDSAQREQSGLRLGLWLGLATLTRLECCLAAIPLGIHFLASRRWRKLLTVGATSLALVSPWIIWSQTNFDTPFPISGLIKELNRAPTDVVLAHNTFVFSLTAMFAGLWWPYIIGDQIVFACGLTLIGLAVTQTHRHRALLAFALCHLLLYVLVADPHGTHDFRRYTTFSGVAIVIAAFSRPRSRQTTKYAWFTLTGLLFCIYYSDRPFVERSLQPNPPGNYVGICHQQAPNILREIATTNDIVGCFDSGAISYFSDVPVVNLDGLVNSDIIDILRRSPDQTLTQRYRAYFAAKHITILVGGSGFSWVNLFPDLNTWPVLHDPIPLEQGEQLIFLRVPHQSPGNSGT